MTKVKSRARRRAALTIAGLAGISSLPQSWKKPIINNVILPAHAQTSTTSLCSDGSSRWLMSEYQENGVDFDQGSPQSEVAITISGNQIDLVTDWFIINTTDSSSSRGRVTDSGTIDLSTGQATTSPAGSPMPSPSHGGVTNLANNLTQSFTLDCLSGNSFVVTGAANAYRFRLTRSTN